MRHLQPSLRALLLGVVISTLATWGCTESISKSDSSPLADPSSVSVQVTDCKSGCTIIADMIPLLPPALKDSLQGAVWLGETTVRGMSGGRVRIGLAGDSGRRVQIPGAVNVIVTIGEVTLRIPLSQLSSPYAVYEFKDSRIIHIAYGLTRSLTSPGAIPVQLVQLTGSAQVVAGRTPWAKTARESNGIMFAPGFDSPCPFNAPGTWCNLSVGIDPYSPLANFGADFQSQGGTTASQTIGLYFGADISSLSISVYDPDYAGNKVVAYDSLGVQVASVDVPYDNTPGQMTVETVTVSAARIRTVFLIPAPADYVAYGGATFVRAPCPPTGDAVLDSPDVRKGMLDLLAASRPNANGTGKKELGDYIYRNADGTYGVTPMNDPNATDCGFLVPGTTPILPTGAVLVAAVHSHPSYAGERLYLCHGQKPGEIRRASRNPNAGGGSPEDWAAADTSAMPMYVIDLDKKVARLDPNTPRSQWPTNPNRWLTGQTSDCLKQGV
jgi:hypothetical protein